MSHVWVGSCTVKDTVKDYVPVDTLIDTDKLLVLLMFRSVMVHVLGTYVFLSRTISFSENPENAQFFAFLSVVKMNMVKLLSLPNVKLAYHLSYID